MEENYDINDAIFSVVEQTLKTGSFATNKLEGIFNNICLGTATEEEIETYKKETNFSDDDIKKIQECFEMGYKIAEENDTSPSENYEERISKLEDKNKILEERISKLEEKVNDIETLLFRHEIH